MASVVLRRTHRAAGHVYVVKASAIRPVEREDGNFDIALIVGRELTSKGAEAYASGLRRQLEKLLPELKAAYDSAQG